MKSAKRSCPVRHDSRFFSLRLCEGCVRRNCPESAAQSSEVPDFGTLWHPAPAEPVRVGTEVFE
ncbi:hypothetical protein JW777_00380 [bacterium]|nr:hypothetical protein [bacterium]